MPSPEALLPLSTPSDPEDRLAVGERDFRDINCLSFAPDRDNPYQGAGILNFVFGETCRSAKWMSWHCISQRTTAGPRPRT